MVRGAPLEARARRIVFRDMLLIPGLHMGEMTTGGRAYLAAHGITCVLVDTGGFDGTLGAGQLIQSAQHPPHEVRLILLTSADAEHAANAAGLRELTGAPLAASREVAAILADPPPPRRRLLGRSDPFPPARVDRIIAPGDRLDFCGGIEVLDAPGNHPGALAYHLVEISALLVGDAAEVDASGLRPPRGRSVSDPGLAAATVERLGAVEVRCVAPGHGLPLVDGRLPRKLPKS